MKSSRGADLPPNTPQAYSNLLRVCQSSLGPDVDSEIGVADVNEIGIGIGAKA